jgi:predicted ribonuclease toxin of YeeF-YezG toxin-antitoxin module
MGRIVEIAGVAGTVMVAGAGEVAAGAVEFAGIISGTARTDEILGAEETVVRGVAWEIAGAVRIAGAVKFAGVVGIAGIVEITEAGEIKVAVKKVVGAIDNAGEETAGIIEIFGVEEIFAGARERLPGWGGEERFAAAIEGGSSVGVGKRGGGAGKTEERGFLGKKGFAHGLSGGEGG